MIYVLHIFSVHFNCLLIGHSFVMYENSPLSEQFICQNIHHSHKQTRYALIYHCVGFIGLFPLFSYLILERPL